MESFEKLKNNCIKPEGWLRRQLELQLNGLSGNIHKLFPDLSDDSAWLGGNGEAWERGPYYLDGVIPLAFLLDDQRLRERVTRWIDSILSSENDYVGFGPKRCVDWWPRFVVLKALKNWSDLTGDERVLPFCMRYFDYLNRNIAKFPPKYWAYVRALECFETLEWCYKQTGDEMLVEVLKKLVKYSFDWSRYFVNFRWTKPTSAIYSRKLFNWAKNLGEKFDEKSKKSLRIPRKQLASTINSFNAGGTVRMILQTHAVNIAMAYKYPVVVPQFLGKTEFRNTAKYGYASLMRSHGVAIGMPTGDEHLMGTSPSQGIELCSVVESMYSMEELLRGTGDADYADILEYVCFNALPATFTADMCSHQYVQQTNQIACDLNKRRQFFALHEDANTFGVAPNFGCCAANMHQGFPKFAQNLAMERNGGLVFPVYSPMSVDTTIGGKRYKVMEQTDYPFGDTIKFRIEQAITDGVLTFRVPKETHDILFNGKVQTFEGRWFELRADFSEGDTVEIVTRPQIRFLRNSDGSVSVRRGRLLYALKLTATEQPLGGAEPPYHNRGFTTTQRWNYGMSIKNDDILDGNKYFHAEGTKYIYYGVPEYPFSKETAASSIKIEGVELQNWYEKNGSAGAYPKRPTVGNATMLTLVPYGNTLLRIAQFPKVRCP